MTGRGRLLGSFSSLLVGSWLPCVFPRVIFLYCSLVLRVMKWMEHDVFAHTGRKVAFMTRGLGMQQC